jgi:heme exporter protein A
MISLEVKNMGKRFGRREVFDQINFSLKEKSSLVITGRNGSGKTTLLKILCGLVRPTNGEISIKTGGRKVDREERKYLLGVVMPDLELYGELTALENLLFLSRIRGQGFGRDVLKEKIQQAGLAGREEDLVATFSSGMKQRLKYALALLFDPRILLLDEPTANLDEEGIILVDRIVSRQREKGILIIATNEKTDLKYGDQILRLGS